MKFLYNALAVQRYNAAGFGGWRFKKQHGHEAALRSVCMCCQKFRHIKNAQVIRMGNKERTREGTKEVNREVNREVNKEGNKEK